MSTAVATARPLPPGRPRKSGRKRLAVLAVLLGALLVTIVLSFAIGAKPVPLNDVWHALTGPTGTENDIVIRSLRIPRTAVGVLAGIALGVAGALMQGHTRNPLADPGLLGVTQGAAFAMVLSIIVLGVTNLYGYIWFGLARRWSPAWGSSPSAWPAGAAPPPP